MEKSQGTSSRIHTIFTLLFCLLAQALFLTSPLRVYVPSQAIMKPSSSLFAQSSLISLLYFLFLSSAFTLPGGTVHGYAPTLLARPSEALPSSADLSHGAVAAALTDLVMSPFESMFARCPPSQGLQPCTCNQTSHGITCGREIEAPITLRYIFQDAANSLKTASASAPTSTNNANNAYYLYSHLMLEHSSLEQLNTDSFEGFAFYAVTIQNHYYLSRFERNVFRTSSTITMALKLDNNPKLGSYPESLKSLFTMIKELHNLERLVIHNCGLTYLPEDAFHNVEEVGSG